MSDIHFFNGTDLSIPPMWRQQGEVFQQRAGLSQQEKCRKSWTQQESKDNQRFISMGNSRFTIFGLSKWETKFEVSQIQWEKKDNQGSFQWEIPCLQYLVYLNGGKLVSTGKGGQPGFTSMENHRFTIFGLSQQEKMQEKLNSFQWEISAGNEFYIPTGNYKFRRVKLEVCNFLLCLLFYCFGWFSVFFFLFAFYLRGKAHANL